MSTLAFNVRGMQAKVGVSITTDLHKDVPDKVMECYTMINARELVSCLADLSFVGQATHESLSRAIASIAPIDANLCSQWCAHARLLLPECACIRACPSMSSIPQPLTKLLLSITSRLDGVLPPHVGGRGDAVNLADKQLVDVSDLQYGLQKDVHAKPLCCCMTHYKNMRPTLISCIHLFTRRTQPHTSWQQWKKVVT